MNILVLTKVMLVLSIASGTDPEHILIRTVMALL